MITPIIIDTSYLVYYHGFATWTWWCHNIGKEGIPDDGTFDPMSDPEYKAAYEKRFLTRIYNGIKNHIVFFNKNELIFALDCHRKNIWRNDVFPEYKMMRAERQKKRDFSWSGIFNYTQDYMIPKYVEEYGVKVFRNRHAEGDDVIAVLVDELYKTNKDIIVIASDGDLVQLTDKCKIITLKGESKTPTSVMSKYKFAVDEEWNTGNFLLHKTIMGDGGDEIPSIVSGVGPKRAFNYLKNMELLKKLDADAKKNLIRNDTLINLKNIPEEIQNDIRQQWNSSTENDLNNL